MFVPYSRCALFREQPPFVGPRWNAYHGCHINTYLLNDHDKLEVAPSVSPLSHSTRTVFESVNLLFNIVSALICTTYLSVGKDTSIRKHFPFLPRSVTTGLLRGMVLSVVIYWFYSRVRAFGGTWAVALRCAVAFPPEQMVGGKRSSVSWVLWLSQHRVLSSISITLARL
jgi:hypothetical protein